LYDGVQTAGGAEVSRQKPKLTFAPGATASLPKITRQISYEGQQIVESFYRRRPLVHAMAELWIIVIVLRLAAKRTLEIDSETVFADRVRPTVHDPIQRDLRECQLPNPYANPIVTSWIIANVHFVFERVELQRVGIMVAFAVSQML